MFFSNDFKSSILRVVFVSTFTTLFAFGAQVSQKRWQPNQSFSEYLVDQKIPLGILDMIDKDDAQFLSEIQSDSVFYELYDEKKGLLQVLIPINTEMQIHLYKTKEGFSFDIIPIDYQEKEYFAAVTIEENLYNDIVRQIHHKKLAARVARSIKNAYDSKRFKVGDEVALLYTQKTRMGFIYGMPEIKSIRIKSQKKEHFIYIDQEDQQGYTDTYKNEPYTVTVKEKVTRTKLVPVASRNFTLPLRNARITSPFSLRRWHPVLKRYRPHHGVDFGAKRGTPIMAIGNGTVSFVGSMRGYGKTVKINHGNGYESLYAHQSSIRVRQGARVRQGEVIGYVGNTGTSTGPHLHLGLYRNKRPINPMSMISRNASAPSVLKKITRYEDVQKTLYKKVPIKNATKNKEKLLEALEQNRPVYIWEDFLQKDQSKEEA
ncbi:MAG TPA: M23 family metallopeptidase [Epsilonproteobacteria bacterium]|nr:M23 family metallopeptidase [Campylobacterota bacterium]